MNLAIPARRRAALHAIRLASMRLDKGVSAETFAQEIDELMAAVRDETRDMTLDTLGRKPTLEELLAACGLDPAKYLAEKSAPPDPDWPVPLRSEPSTRTVTGYDPAPSEATIAPKPAIDGLGLSPAPLNSLTATAARRGFPKLTDEQKARLCEEYLEVTKDRDRSPDGWITAKVVEYGASAVTIYKALSPVMADRMTEKVVPPRAREIKGTYGTTGRKERGAMA